VTLKVRRALPSLRTAPARRTATHLAPARGLAASRTDRSCGGAGRARSAPHMTSWPTPARLNAASRPADRV